MSCSVHAHYIAPYLIQQRWPGSQKLLDVQCCKDDVVLQLGDCQCTLIPAIVAVKVYELATCTDQPAQHLQRLVVPTFEIDHQIKRLILLPQKPSKMSSILVDDNPVTRHSNCTAERMLIFLSSDDK